MKEKTKNKMNNTFDEKAIQSAKLVLRIDDVDKKIKRGTLAEEINDMIQYIKVHQIEGLEIDEYKEGLQVIRKMNQEEYSQFLENVFQEIKLEHKFMSDSSVEEPF